MSKNNNLKENPSIFTSKLYGVLVKRKKPREKYCKEQYTILL